MSQAASNWTPCSDQIVTLTTGELLHATHVGTLRRVDALTNMRKSQYGTSEKHFGWQNALSGALAEQAFAKWADMDWRASIKPDNDVGDVGPFHVRSQAEHENPHLILHPRDLDDAVFVLVTGYDRTWSIRGCLRAKDGKKDEFWDETKRFPAFFVPFSALTDAQEFVVG